MDLLIIIFELILADLILGGDNAVVISMATKDLPKELRLKGSLYGALAAILLRVAFIMIVLKFGEMHIMVLNIIAGGFLVKIAFDLIAPGNEEHNIKGSSNLREAVKTIVIADAVMSFDNAVVIASIAEKAQVSHAIQLLLIVSALLISFPIVLFGARLLTTIIEKYSVIVYFFGLILIHVGLELISQDSIFSLLHIHAKHSLVFILLWVSSFIILGVCILKKRSK